MVINSINPGTMTKFIKKDQLTSSWYEIDAKNAVVGRLASIISKIIRGKNKTTCGRYINPAKAFKSNDHRFSRWFFFGTI